MWSNVAPAHLSVAPYLFVPNAPGKQPLVLDLRYVNQLLSDRKFMYEGLELILICLAVVIFSQLLT